ncbi:MAG TPA: non-homologous end-joining DNA ligase [Salinimicrobium sp.]|nr:non-homologous end-joining DNA ligase [Salinimicrobium sp.]
MKIEHIEITHPDRIIFTKKKITKGDVVLYYEKAAEKMLPFLKNRPLTLQRFPDGIKEQGFYQKNASEYFPSFIKRIEIETEEGMNTQFLCNSKKALIYLANQGAVTFHTWLSKKDKINHPDKIVFDLDPSKGDFSQIKKAAFLVKDFLEAKKIVPKIGSTGQNGVHVSYKIRRTRTFDEIKKKTKEMAEELVKLHPEIFTTQIRKNKREGKIFLDYLRNEYAQTIVCPFSLRANEEAGIAVPLDWDQFENISNSKEFNFSNIENYLKKNYFRF